MPRRTFLKQAAAAGFGLMAGASVPSGRAAELQKKGRTVDTSSDLPIVDTHQHLWDLRKFRLPWLKGAEKLDRSFLMQDYLEAAAGLNVRKTIYMEVDLDPQQQLEEAEYVIDLCRRDDNPMVAAVISGRPASPGFEHYIRRFKGSPYVKGVRQVLHGQATPPGYCLSPDFIRGIRLLGDLGMSFDVCVRPAELGDAAKLVDACPGTRFILDHCGNADPQALDRSQWERDIAAVATRKNVVCKISGIIARLQPGQQAAEVLAPIVRHCLKCFSSERVMFAGDWPVCTLGASLREWVTALKQIVSDRKPEERRRLFYDNAMRFYGLS
jgi:L-fuconolactonase